MGTASGVMTGLKRDWSEREAGRIEGWIQFLNKVAVPSAARWERVGG